MEVVEEDEISEERGKYEIDSSREEQHQPNITESEPDK